MAGWDNQIFANLPRPRRPGQQRSGPFTAADIVGGAAGPVQEARPWTDPTVTGQVGQAFERGAERLGAPMSVQRTAGEIGQQIAGMTPLALHDIPQHLSDAWNYLRYGAPGQAALSTLAAVPPVIPGAKTAEEIATGAARAMTEVPSIRGLPTADAVAIARGEPHLIPAGAGSKGAFVGGPQDVQSYADLQARRAAFDQYAAKDPRGFNWYDRYREGLNRATGGDPEMNRWMSTMQGSFSQGVSPQSELGYVLKEANSALAGQPTRAGMTTQHDAFMDAVAQGDPNLMQLGPKTEEYAGLVNPDRTAPPGATGVNDFRYANQWGYTPGEGVQRKGDVSLTAPQHTFMDYETALAVDRANKAAMGGRTDWTGERLQAVPWVIQKAEALSTAPRAPLALRGNYDAAFAEAQKTAPDFFGKHLANATYEAQPGASIPGHMPGAAAAPPGERAEYMAAPGSSWATAPSPSLRPGELPRDAIYGGLRLNDTGVGMYTLPSTPMQGYYPNAQGALETNPGIAAHPAVAFSTEGGGKTIMPPDASILDAGELARSYFGAQEAGAWHKSWPAERLKDVNAVTVPLDRAATPDELTRLRDAGEQHGFPHVVDTGQGVTVTNFDGTPALDAKKKSALIDALDKAKPEGAGTVGLSQMQSGYQGLVDAWKQGQGSGAATRQLLDALNQSPTLREAFNQNPFIPPVAAAQAQRDADWAARWGAPRPDIQNARVLAGQGPGWVDRLQKALAAGVPAGVGLTPSAGLPATGPNPSPQAPSADLMADWLRQMQASYSTPF